MSDRKALLVIDMQRDYLWDKRKTMFSYNTNELVGNVNNAIHSYKEEFKEYINKDLIRSNVAMGCVAPIE